MTDPARSRSLSTIATHPNENLLLGRIAVHLDMITADELAWALREQSREGGTRNIGELMVERGLIDRPQLDKLLETQRQVRERHARAAAAQPAPPRPAATSSGEPARAVPSSSGTLPGSETVSPATAPPGRPSPPPPAPQAAPQASAPSSARSAAPIDGFLRMAAERGASDLHLHSGLPIRLRIHGDFLPVPSIQISHQDTRRLIEGILDPEQRGALEEDGQVDFSYTLPGVARFRANAYRQQHGLDAVFRVISLQPPSLAEIGLPLELARFANHHQGMVLITGPAGCGKSTTLAALIRLINEERRQHIITIEDPIEYLHPSLRCIVNQRQVVRHTGSFARALRAALREDPDVIVIGELRDLETISLALSAAETGHLVLATLHTTNSIATINRIVGAFPPAQQAQVRTMVSESLRGVLSQRLVKRKDGRGRVPALEVLACTPAVGNLIREQKTFQIRSIIQTGAAQGMCLLDASLRNLVMQGVITHEEALHHCENRSALGATPTGRPAGASPGPRTEGA